jgi:hypothetical protein
MAKRPTTTKTPRTALTETPSTTNLPNKKRAADNSTSLPSKKPKTAAVDSDSDSSDANDPSSPPKFLKDIILPGEEEVPLPSSLVDKNDIDIFDDCNTIRRKIRALLATGVKQTHFLEWVNVNSNSYRNFMSYKDKYQGVNNHLQYAGYRFLCVWCMD